MSGTLFVVATPIGNLEDITLRALRMLREAQVIAAEDTRRTARLLAHHGIATPMLSFHAHNTRARLPGILSRLERGDRVAIVTDAGTPGVSDPGVELVRACIDRGIAVEPVPGPSAALGAAVGAGFPLEPLTFLGFPPYRAKDRMSWLEQAFTLPHTLVFFEAPHRIRQTLTDAQLILGERRICVVRELTKIHEEFQRGTAKEIIGRMTTFKGEFTVVVGPAEESLPVPVEPSAEEIADEFRHATKNGPRGRRAAVSALARKYRLPSREIYQLIESSKDSGR